MSTTENNKKTALMICYYYPPLITSGVFRSLHFSLLMPRCGWTPLVITVKKAKDPWVKCGEMPSLNVEIIRTTEFNLTGLCDFFHGVYSRIMRLFGIDTKINYFRELFCHPDGQISWLTTPSAFFLKNRYQIIYVTCSPFSSTLSGVRLKLLTKKPLVIDFRDPWTLNPHSNPTWLRRIIDEYLERLMLRFTDALILNTEGALGDYCKKYPQYKNKMCCIPSGYDSLTPVSNVAYQESLKNITIVHAGTFYESRTPRAILEAICLLPEPRPRFLQVGEDHPDFDEFRDRVSITVTGVVPREEAIKHMCSASLLYIKQGFEQGITNYTAIAAKTYEYLATGLPILVDAPEGDNSNIVKKYAKNAYIVTTEKPSDLHQALLKFLSEKQQITPEVNRNFIEDFNNENLTNRLCEIFNSLTI